MAHHAPMKNVRLPAPLVERAATHQRTKVLDVGLKEVDGTYPGYGWRQPHRLGSTTKVLAAAVRIGLDELDRRLAVSDAKQEKLPLE